MKKQYISPLCNVVAMETGSCILAASGPANPASAFNLAGETSNVETSDDDDMWAGAKSSVFDLDD